MSQYIGVESAVLWCCETKPPKEGRYNDTQKWEALEDVAIIGFQLEAHIHISRNARSNKDGKKNLIASAAYLTFDSENIETWLIRALAYMWYRNKQWVGTTCNQQQIMFPEGCAVLLKKGECIYLQTIGFNTTKANQGVGSQATLYYVREGGKN